MTTNVSKNAEYSAAWRARNPEKAKAVAAAYRERNPEKTKAARKSWRLRNLETIRIADAERSREYTANNKAKVSAAKAVYYQKNRERLLAKSAEQRKKRDKKEFYFVNIKRKFGLAEEQFLLMLERQGGKCAICEDIFVSGEGRRKTANVDHCHASGTVRGLLCGGCNTGLGNLKDAPELLRRAADYLERHK